MSINSVKNKKLKLPIRKIISNNLFIIRLFHKASAGLLLCNIVTTILDSLARFVSSTLILRFALNGINKGQSFKSIVTVILFWLAVQLVITLSLAVYNQSYLPRQMKEVKKYFCNIVYEKAAAVELECYETPKYYDKFKKAVDECGIRVEGASSAIKELLSCIIGLSANFTLIVVIDPVLFFFVVIPILAIPLQIKMNKVRYIKNMKIAEESRRKDYARRVFYLADYAKEMRLSEMPELMLKRFTESGMRIIKIINEHGFSLAVCGYLITECNRIFASLGATLYAVWQTFVRKGMMYGDCLVIVNSIDNINHAIADSANVFMKFQENALYIENLTEFLSYEPTIKGGRAELPDDGSIVLDQVSFRYEGASHDTLRNVSMRIGAKEKVAIVGHNGAGKSTLVKLLLRLYEPDAGKITYGNINIKEFPLSEYRKMFSTVLQDFHVFALTVAENVMMDSRKDDDTKIIHYALEKSGLKQKTDSFAKGIDTLLTREFDEDGKVFSGGEQQMLAIAHVYSKANKFVILDEPSSALDPVAENEMYIRMMEACSDCGMIFISHRLSSAVMADRIYLIENGEVAECGTHQMLMEQDGKYADMFRRQAINYCE